MNIVFDRNTKKLTGVNRPPTAFELEVRNVKADDDSLIEIVRNQSFPKLDEKGNFLYYLPQPSLTEIIPIFEDRVTINPTDRPIMIKVEVKVPMTDKDGNPLRSKVTEKYETTKVTDEPVMIPSEENPFELTQKQDKDGNPLYYEEIWTGEYKYYYTIEHKEEQKTNEAGQPLFYKNEKVGERKVEVPQPPLEITVDDEDYVDSLNQVFYEKPINSTVNFLKSLNGLTYDEVVSYKKLSLIAGMYTDAILVEDIQSDVFAEAIGANFGFDSTTLEAKGSVVTKAIKLSDKYNVVGISFESSNNNAVSVMVGNATDDFVEINRNGEVYFSAEFDEVFVKFVNKNDAGKVEINSFAVLM